jgi:putative heme-binding domain-containing protein
MCCIANRLLLISLLGFGVLTPEAIFGQAKKKERFQVPEGFRVEQIVKVPSDGKRFAIQNLCFDAQGRLLVSRQDGGIYLCTDPDENGVLQKVTLYSDIVTDCQGMCWVDDALVVVGIRKGAQESQTTRGVHRIRKSPVADQPDSAELLLGTSGMSQHGPHAILHGPDGFLYFVTGNASFVNVGKDGLAKNSPHIRWPKSPGPEQGKPRTTEDFLLPWLGRSGADGMNAPNGTIWRLDANGKNLSLFAAGFRNQYDAAFNPRGELFSFDSDMEWDLNLPWYRPVRICHASPGADFMFRAGTANMPSYYLDSTPPLYETGRGSPTGVECYDHYVFPEKYHGALFLCDYNGCIWAVQLKRDGATYKPTVEKFCTGEGMNVTDLAVAPDGSLVFAPLGSEVFRIVATTPAPNSKKEFLGSPQPLSAWGRAAQREYLEKNLGRLPDLAKSGESAELRLRALDGLHRTGKLDARLLEELTLTSDPEIAAHALYYLGMYESPNRAEVLTKALKHGDALVRRRACDALIRADIEPEIAAIWPVLGDADHFTATAARLVVERIDPKKWADRIAAEKSDLVVEHAIIALAHHHNAADRAELIFNRLAAVSAKEPHELLNWLRVLELALLHTTQRPDSVKTIAAKTYDLFPHANDFVNRSLAIALTQFQREGILAKPFQAKVIPLLQDSKGDREQQIHYYYCLRLLKDGWRSEDCLALAEWYDRTKTWTGDSNFHRFMASMYTQCLNSFTPQNRQAIIKNGDKRYWAAQGLLLRAETEDIGVGLADMLALHQRVKDTNVEKDAKPDPQWASFRQALDEAIARHYLEKPTAESWPFLVNSVRSNNPILRSGALTALQKLTGVKPKADDAKAYRLVLEATNRTNLPKEKWQTIELIRQWTGKSFGSEPTDWEREWNNWARWFLQSYPKEPNLPKAPSLKPGESKYTMSELLTYLEKDPQGKKADPLKGRIVFEKAQCIKCHKFGKEGDAVGPDLTALAKRFKRQEMMDSILFPSKTIIDQYRSSTISTTKGQVITGLVAEQGETISVLQADASRITLKKSDVEAIVPSLVSVMPERLLDALTKQEIAELIAFLEMMP